MTRAISFINRAMLPTIPQLSNASTQDNSREKHVILTTGKDPTNTFIAFVLHKAYQLAEG